MRVTSEIWISAAVRRAFSAGGFAAIARRGAAAAGAIMIVRRDRLGGAVLYGPAPQTFYDEARPDDRQFVVLTSQDDAAVDARIEREARFDPDLWVVEFELDESRFLEIVPVTTP